MVAKKTPATKKTVAKKTPVKKKTAVKKTPAKKKATAKKTGKVKFTDEQIYSMVEQAAYFSAENDGFSKEPHEYWRYAETAIKAMVKI